MRAFSLLSSLAIVLTLSPALAARAVRTPTTVCTVKSSTRPCAVRVQPGDTLFKIARRHSLSLERLRNLNRIYSDTIRVEQVLRLRPLTPREPTARPRPRFRGPAVRLEHYQSGRVRAELVRVNLLDPRVLVSPVLPPRGLGRGMDFGSMARTSGAAALVNGGYFHPRSFIPSGDVVVQGSYVFAGKIRSALAITPDNRASIRGVGYARKTGWNGFESVLASGPFVLRGGRIEVNARAEGYRDPAVWGRAPRTAVGLSGSRQLLLFSTRTPLTLTELAGHLKRLGARDALLLDGGSSVGMAWKGQVRIRPARKISFGLGVFVDYTGKRTGR